mmetsp:Transcript_79908/g.111021  ORF Transcript_79908/g.111021 Transcript_79908/m.111021 type:complete len:201 (-) Transcript_79908:336-938(-)
MTSWEPRSRCLTPSCHSVKPVLPNLIRLVLPSRPTSTIVSLSKLNLSAPNCARLSMTETSSLEPRPRHLVATLLTTLGGMFLRPGRFGPLDLKEPDPTFSLTLRRESTTFLRSRSQLLVDLLGPRRMVLCAKNRCAVQGTTSWMWSCTLMPFIVEWVKSCLLLVVYASPPCSLVIQVSSSLCTCVISLFHKMPWETFTVF